MTEIKYPFIEYLNDPHLVARFQRFFGVRSPGPNPTTEQKELSPSQNRHNHNSSSRRNSNEDQDQEEQVQIQNNNTKGVKQRGGRTTTTNRSSSKDKDSFNFDQVVTNKFWYYLFKFGTALGDELFYSCWFSFWFWNVDGAVGRRVVLLWGILMYIGQGLKDIIRWPRPSVPPVVRLEKKWELEYGMPSTHAVVGAAVPFATLIFTSERYQYPLEIGIIGALSWCTIVCMSRLYLGMHTVLDVIAGLLLVLVCFFPVIPLVDWLDPLLVQNEYGGLSVFLVAVILCFCTPGGDRWSTARSDTFVILGSCVGLVSGAWFNFQSGVISGPPLDPPYAVIWPSPSMLLLSILRMVIGLILVLATRAIMKTSLYAFFHKFLKIEKKTDLNTASHLEVFAELSQKFLTYVIIGLNITCCTPAIFRLIGIQRPTFHTEI